jgi:hypothetical protein
MIAIDVLNIGAFLVEKDLIQCILNAMEKNASIITKLYLDCLTRIQKECMYLNVKIIWDFYS